MVAPGAVLPVDLLINPLNPYRTQAYSFKVASRPVEPPVSRPVFEEGSFKIKGISWFSRFLTHLFFVLVTAIVVLAAVLLLMYLGI